MVKAPKGAFWYDVCNMQIEFSNHALDQLEVRSRITRRMVLEAVQNPDNVIESHRDRRVYQKSYGKETLEIVAIQEHNILIIITEYFLDEL